MELVTLKGDLCLMCMNIDHPDCERTTIEWGGPKGVNIVKCDCFLGTDHQGKVKRDWNDAGFFVRDDSTPIVKEPPKEPTKGKYVSNFE